MENNLIERIGRLLIGEDVTDSRRKMLDGLHKQLEYERARQKSLKTPEDKAKGTKRIADIQLSIAKVNKGAESDRKKG
jgi:hypothetical protein